MAANRSMHRSGIDDEPWYSLKSLGRMIIYRYPFCDSLTLVMLCAERAGNNRDADGDAEGYPRPYIYFRVVFLILMGSMLSFKVQRPLFALLSAADLSVFVYLTHSSKGLQFDQWLSIRMVSRSLAVICAYLTIASRRTEKLKRHSKLHFLFPVARHLYGTFLLVYTYSLHYSRDDQKAFTAHIPGQELSLYAFMALTLLGTFSFLSNQRIQTACRALLIGLPLITLCVDADLAYWTSKGPVEYWNQVRILLETVVASALLMLLVYDQ